MIFITGAFGNAGQYIVRRLLKSGFDVIACDVKNRHHTHIAAKLSKLAIIEHRQLKVVWADLTKDDVLLEETFTKNNITAVVHLAYIIPPWTEIKPEYAYQVNVLGTKKILALTEKYCPQVPYLFASSTTVFGNKLPEVDYVNEDHRLEATSNYTRHKIDCEETIRSSKLAWRILRFSFIMNPVLDPDKESMELGRNISLKTCIEPVHPEDVATAIHNAIMLPQTANQVFIISGGKVNQMTYRDFIERMLKGIVGAEEKDIPWDRFADKPYYLHWYDTSKSQGLLTYQERTIEDYIKDAVDNIPAWKKILMKLVGPKVALKHFFPD